MSAKTMQNKNEKWKIYDKCHDIFNLLEETVTDKTRLFLEKKV